MALIPLRSTQSSLWIEIRSTIWSDSVVLLWQLSRVRTRLIHKAATKPAQPIMSDLWAHRLLLQTMAISYTILAPRFQQCSQLYLTSASCLATDRVNRATVVVIQETAEKVAMSLKPQLCGMTSRLSSGLKMIKWGKLEFRTMNSGTIWMTMSMTTCSVKRL